MNRRMNIDEGISVPASSVGSKKSLEGDPLLYQGELKYVQCTDPTDIDFDALKIRSLINRVS